MGELLARGLRAEGHVVDLARDGAEGLDFARVGAFDAIVLDVMLPRVDGLEIARRLRKERVRTPILMLTAMDAKKNVVTGLDAGADDYLAKPFAFEELLARLRALLRRAPTTHPPRLQVADLTLDPASREVKRGERSLKLTPREFQILELLMRRAGSVVSRATIIDNVWGQAADIESNTVDVFVSTLRAKVDAHPPALITTVRGVGFTMAGRRS